MKSHNNNTIPAPPDFALGGSCARPDGRGFFSDTIAPGWESRLSDYVNSLPLSNPPRCGLCGRFVGNRYAGHSNDRMSNRGMLFCERCVMEVYE